MKILQKYIYIVMCSIMLIMVSVFVSDRDIPPYIYFCVDDRSQSNTNDISIYDAQDGNFYVFLPSYADMERVSVVLNSNRTFSLDEISLSNGMSCEEFEIERPYTFCIDNCKVATLWFYHSSNVATMYIDTVTGSMDYIHEDKEHKEHASVALYTADGDLDYCDKLITLEGRGNTSWSLPKKPYTMTLRQSSQLLDMGASVKWVLNSSGFDVTNLRNEVIYKFADSIAPNPSWSPDCAYVEVYFNGDYAGLYLLCQKIDAGHDHLNLEQDDYFWSRPLLAVPGIVRQRFISPTVSP